MFSSMMFRAAVLVTATVATAMILPSWILTRIYASRIHTPAEAPHSTTAIVFGAGLVRGRPSRVLADRVASAASLYHAGRVDTLLMSGSSTADGHDEPAAMKALAVELGVPAADIVLDPGGNRTLETCLRAVELYGIREALLVTQRFHLPRALVVCRAMGMEASGVAADLRPYRALQYRLWQLRELPATLVALVESFVVRPRLQANDPGPSPETPWSDM